jgi:hypothetical protein
LLGWIPWNFAIRCHADLARQQEEPLGAVQLDLVGVSRQRRVDRSWISRALHQPRIGGVVAGPLLRAGSRGWKVP